MSWLEALRMMNTRQEPDDGMGGFKYGPFYQLWMQRQQQQVPTPWVGQPGIPGKDQHVPTPWVGGPQQPGPMKPDVPTPWVGMPQPVQKPAPGQWESMAQRRPPMTGVIRR